MPFFVSPLGEEYVEGTKPRKAFCFTAHAKSNKLAVWFFSAAGIRRSDHLLVF
jgi:hypothetical protein